MKNRFIKYCRFVLAAIIIMAVIAACNNNESLQKKSYNASDSTITDNSNHSMTIPDSIAAINPDENSIMKHRAGRRPASIPQEEKVAKGYAVAYCPSRMIEGVPSILYAVISKEDFDVIQNLIIKQVSENNSGISSAQIEKDTKGDTIPLYNKMKVELAIDDDVFKKISEDESIKTFGEQKSLEWSWTIKPKQITHNSIISFRFFAVDSSDHSNLILTKTINVAVKVDTRTIADKWIDFLSNDPKTLLTVIIVPLVTFAGGLFWGKKKKKK